MKPPRLNIAGMILAVAFLISPLTMEAANAQTRKPMIPAPEEVVRRFYDWYLGELRNGGEPFKQENLMKEFLTDEFFKEISERTSKGDEFDPVITYPRAERFWHNMTVKVPPARLSHGRLAIWVTYSCSSCVKKFTEVWIVGLRRTNHGWRINSIVIAD